MEVSNQKPPPQAPLNTTAERRSLARTKLFEYDKDFLSTDELVIMFQLLGENDDFVDSYLLLTTLPTSTDEVQYNWLKRRIAMVDEGSSR